MKKGYKQVTQKEFDLTKQLGLAGLGPKKISFVTGRSTVTIGKMLKAESLADYRKKASEAKAQRRINTTQGQMPVSVLDTDVIVNVPELLRKVAAYLERGNDVK